MESKTNLLNFKGTKLPVFLKNYSKFITLTSLVYTNKFIIIFKIEFFGQNELFNTLFHTWVSTMLTEFNFNLIYEAFECWNSSSQTQHKNFLSTAQLRLQDQSEKLVKKFHSGKITLYTFAKEH